MGSTPQRMTVHQISRWRAGRYERGYTRRLDIRGAVLDDAGYRPGDVVEITLVSPGVLMVTPADPAVARAAVKAEYARRWAARCERAARLGLKPGRWRKDAAKLTAPVVAAVKR